jgi:hypothetical protein
MPTATEDDQIRVLGIGNGENLFRWIAYNHFDRDSLGALRDSPFTHDDKVIKYGLNHYARDWGHEYALFSHKLQLQDLASWFRVRQ